MSCERLRSTCPMWGRTIPRAASTAFSSILQGKKDDKPLFYSVRFMSSQGSVTISDVQVCLSVDLMSSEFVRQH